MRFQIDIDIKKIVQLQPSGLVIIYCDKPRALGEILRHNHGIHKFAMTIWGHGVTLMPSDFAIVKGALFADVEIIAEEEE